MYFIQTFFRSGDHLEKFIQFLAGILIAIGTVRYPLLTPAFSDFANPGVTEDSITFSQTTLAVDVLGFDIGFVLF